MASSTTVDFNGHWRLYKNENFDEYYEKVEGMPWSVRKMAQQVNPDMVVEQSNDHFKITITALWFKNVSEFNVGQEFLFDPNQDGHNLKSRAHWEGDKLIVNATPENPDDSRILSQTSIRELNGPDETIITIRTRLKEDPDIEICIKRFFKRIS